MLLTPKSPQATKHLALLGANQNEKPSSPVSTYTEIYTHDPPHNRACMQGLQTTETSTFHISKQQGEGSASSFTTARGGEERRGVSPDALVAGRGYGGGRRRGGRKGRGSRLHGREAGSSGDLEPRPRRDRSRPFRARWPRRRRRRRGSGVRGFYWLRGSEGQRDEEAEPPAEDRRS